MIVTASVEELRQALAGKAVGFVPTMGALHEGHASLLRKSAAENEHTVLSIFVNPTQFGPTEDFSRYPRTLEADLALAKECGVTHVFTPTEKVIYPEGWNTFIEVENLTSVWCGKYRPGHFRGVTTVVYRLFQIVRPERAYFGQKDLQQFLVLQRMVRDLELPLAIEMVSTLREEDGLAKSSRNRYLSEQERAEATVIFRAMQAAKSAYEQGEKNPRVLELIACDVLKDVPAFQLQYAELRSLPDLQEVSQVQGKVAMAIAGFLGKTRLIDNIIF